MQIELNFVKNVVEKVECMRKHDKRQTVTEGIGTDRRRQAAVKIRLHSCGNKAGKFENNDRN